MSTEEMEEEIELLRDQLEYVNRELETIRDEKDKQISDLEFKVGATRAQVEGEFRSRMRAADKEYKSQLSSINLELDRLRQAFSGDAGGWEEQTKKNGEVFYLHKETKETRETEPEALYIAKAMQRVELADSLGKELEELKVKFKASEMKKKEFELKINKLKSEMNSLKTMEKGWKDSASAIYTNMKVVTKQLDNHYDQIAGGLKGFARSQHRMKNNIPKLSNLTNYIQKLQQRVTSQENEIRELNGKIRTLATNLEDKTKKVEKLSAGIDEEIERLCKPMREKMADCMVQVMKTKVARAQERREIADLWPPGYMLPTILMKSRTLNESERNTRIEKIKRADASLALSLEIRANMTESKLWEVKYDDYGRPFYQHSKTGQVSQEEPEIVSYKPPKGRDEMGNISIPDDSASWSILCDYKGEVCYRHNETKQISYFPPEAYPTIPPPKSAKLLVADAARLVLNFIKTQISNYLASLSVEADPKTAGKDKEKDKEKEKEKEEIKGDSKEDLSKYVYDMQTIEMLANLSDMAAFNQPEKDEDEEGKAQDKDSKLESKVHNDYIGPSLVDVDLLNISVDNVREILENLANLENVYDRKLKLVRNNTKDFSYLLFDVIKRQKEKEEQELIEKKEREKKERAEARAIKREKRRQEKLNKRMEDGLDGEGTVDGSISLTSSQDMISQDIDNMSSIAGNTLGSTLPPQKQNVEEDPPDLNVEPDFIDAEENEIVDVEYELNEYGEKIPIVKADNKIALGDNNSITSELTGAGAGSFTGQARGGISMPAQTDLDLDDAEQVYPVVGDPTLGPSPTENILDLNLEEVVERLVGLTIYCGFTNLRIDEAPDDANIEYNFDLDTQNKLSDDKWLSCSYFITTNKERVDAIRENINLQYDSVLGCLKINYLNDLRLIYDVKSQGVADDEKYVPVLPSITSVQKKLADQYKIWKSQQLVAEVLRFQIQQEAIRDAYKGREASRYLNSNSSHFSMVPEYSPEIAVVEFKVVQIHGSNIPRDEYSLDQLQYVRITFGNWSVRVNSERPKRQGLVWDNLNYRVTMPTKAIFYDKLLVQVFDESSLRQDVLICSGSCSLSNTIGFNMGRNIELTINLTSEKDMPSGEIKLTVHADQMKPQPLRDYDPKQLLGENLTSSQSVTKVYNVSTHVDPQDELSGIFPSLVEEQSNFTKLVSDLRGDGDNFVKMLTADIDQKSILRLGHRANKNYVKKLPSIDAANKLIQLKTNLQEEEIKIHVEETEQYHNTVISGIKERIELLQKALNEARKRFEELYEKSQNSLEDTARVIEKAEEFRNEKPKPLEPDFSTRPEYPMVFQIPKIGGIDSKGKKLKALPSADEKALIQKIKDGGCDGVEWDFDIYWPSSGQAKKFKKAIDARNMALLELREKEKISRDAEMVAWKESLETWELEDKKRIASFSKMKKDLRRTNLRTDCFNSRVDRVQSDINQLEWDISMWNGFLELHNQSRDRYNTMRSKIYVERYRHFKAVDHLKSKLVRILDARRRALDLPQGAQNHLEFEELRQKAEIALRTLRFEIIQVKHSIIEEGVRLRNIMHEEAVCCKSELMRTRILVEIIRQKSCVEKIVERHRYEVLHLMEDLEKLKLAEAEKDDIGIDTIDDLGERFSLTKVWKSSEIEECNRVINTILSKINLTEGVIQTNLNSQKSVLDALCVKWGTEYLTYRDSWVENSDYERSKKVMYDMISWVAAQRDKLGRKDAELNNYREELFLELAALQEQNDLSFQCQSRETDSMAEATLRAINVVKDKLNHVREDSKIRLLSLDKSMTEISRDSQKLREDMMKEKVHYEEKINTLLSLIATLQTTLQTLSAKVEIIANEKEKVVTVAKLEADRLKYQLRCERQHCTNLLFILHSQKGFIFKLQDKLARFHRENVAKELSFYEARKRLRTEVWEQVFCFTQLCTNVDSLFEFFTLRLSNLAGSRKSVNEAFHRNNAAVVLSALCKSPRTVIRKLAARALAGMGWDGYVETRVLMWDSVMQWKLFKANVLQGNNLFYKNSLEGYVNSGKLESLLTVEGNIDEFEPSENVSLRTLIKQRRQWALRATRRHEGPNRANQKLLNVKDGVIPTLLQLCKDDGKIDWEIVRNAALALSISSFDPQNHHHLSNDDTCVKMLIFLCKNKDVEIVTHAAITIANLCHMDENAQLTFGASGAIEVLLSLCNLSIVDALEAATSALSNMTCLCDPNCRRVLEIDGVKKLVKLVTQAYSENLLNLDQNEEVQANAAEILANVSRFNGELTSKHFDCSVIDSLVIMCASTNKLVKRLTPLVLGNISQNETCRILVGNRGGVEALFLILEDTDNVIQANALWSLCNLMWYPSNQERAGRFMSEVLTFLDSSWFPVKSHACILIANMVYYNNSNRVKFLEAEGSTEKILSFISSREEKSIVEACLRIILSLSYLDQVALWLGTDGNCIPLFISLIQPAFLSRDVMRYSLEILCNLCIHHINRRKILDNAGIEAIVSLHTDVDPNIRETSIQVIEHLEDVTPPEVLSRVKQQIGIDQMVQLASSSDALVRAVAAESIGEEVWRNPKLQKKATNAGGIEALLGILSNATEEIESLLPSLWSLRNILYNSTEAKSVFENNKGIQITIQTLSRALTGVFVDQSEKVFEACLILLATAIVGNDKNARRLLVIGLEIVMDIAEGKLADSAGTDDHVRRGLNSDSIIALSKSILQILGPYNYVVCRNCHKKQELRGTHCFNCGNALLVDIQHKLKGKDSVKLLMSSSVPAIPTILGPIKNFTGKKPI